jgi:hypothetical protein
MTRDVPSNAFFDKLNQLFAQAAAFIDLGYELRGEIKEGLSQIEPDSPAALRRAGRRYLAEVSNAQLRQDLVEVRGEQSAAVLRTKLNSTLEVRRGRRHACNGEARVNGHGRGIAL